MKWVTRKHVHLDRVASPWLITRFIDTQAEFTFIDPNEPWSDDATAFALPGAALGAHDQDGPTFGKILHAYGLEDPVLTQMADIIHAGIRHVLEEHTRQVPSGVLNEGIALAMISEGVMLQHDDDHSIIEASMGIYDALFAALWGRRCEPVGGTGCLLATHEFVADEMATGPAAAAGIDTYATSHRRARRFTRSSAGRLRRPTAARDSGLRWRG